MLFIINKNQYNNDMNDVLTIKFNLTTNNKCEFILFIFDKLNNSNIFWVLPQYLVVKDKNSNNSKKYNLIKNSMKSIFNDMNKNNLKNNDYEILLLFIPNYDNFREKYKNDFDEKEFLEFVIHEKFYNYFGHYIDPVKFNNKSLKKLLKSLI